MQFVSFVWLLLLPLPSGNALEGWKEGGGGKFDRTDKSNVGLDRSTVGRNQIKIGGLLGLSLSLDPKNPTKSALTQNIF